MAVTEAEVKRLLADAIGKRLHATRLASLDRLRGHLASEPRRSVAMSAAIDGLLSVATDAKQPADVRMRAGEVLGAEVDLDALRERFRAWPEGWTARLRAVAAADELPAGTRLLAVKAVEARVLEEPGLEAAATRLMMELLSSAEEPTELRVACLHALADMHRGTPSFFAEERRLGGLVTAPLPRDAAWRDLSADERALAAALADPVELAELIERRPCALEASSLLAQWDPSAAKLLAERVRRLPFDREVEGRHAELLRTAVEYDRSQGVLSLEWIAPVIVDVALAAAKQALQHGAAPRYEEHVRLWLDLFRDNARGLAERLLGRLGEEHLALPWVALHALASFAPDLAAEGDRRALTLLQKTPKLPRLDVLVALVVPELAADLQESGLLPAVDVPTEEELGRLYRDEAQSLPRRVRLLALARHVAEVDDRFLVSLQLLPDVIRWLPSELFRFEPLLRVALDVAAGATDRRLRAGARIPFDAMLRILEAVKVSPVPLADFARQASIHGLPASELAPYAADEPELRAFWSALVRSRNLPLEKRLDAWRALDLLAWAEKEDELGELGEELLLRVDDSEVGSVLVEPFRRRWPVRFATIASRLRISVPPISRVPPGARDALAAAVSADETLATIEAGELTEKVLGAIALLRGVIARRPDLRERARTALAKRVKDDRVHESMGVAVAAFEEQVALFEDDAAHTLAEALELGDDQAQAAELARRFAESATSPMKQSALVELERGVSRLLGRASRSSLGIEASLGAYCEAIARLGDAGRLRDRLRRVMVDRTAGAGARYASFAVLEAARDVDREALLDAAVAMFFDESEDGAFRALLGGIVTIGKPQAFIDIVDMNLQPWVVQRPEHVRLPASSLSANMPMSWLLATVAMAQHDEPIARAAAEIATRVGPSKPWEWARARSHFLTLVKGQEEPLRRGLRAAAAAGSLDAAKLLALFGDLDDTEALAAAAVGGWIPAEQEASLADTVFWRPAGKAPAFGRYSALEPWLEAGFGTSDRYRILSLAYAELAEHAEGGDASRYAYEAFLLDPGSARASEAMSKFSG